MLYKFKSKNTGDVIMLEPNGRHVLEAIGKEPGPQGIIQVAQMQGAIDALHAAIAKEEAAAHEEDAAPVDGPSFRVRALPFIEMLQRCKASGDDIVWGV
ncbi:MAG: DUF1840 domain-containing protein [Comamonadaceae bacterium]|nr:MAG: DUF1840 domain-containing protein [Comamonadaceae bacterium]